MFAILIVAFMLPLAVAFWILWLEFLVIRKQLNGIPESEKELRRSVTKKYMLGLSRSNALIIAVSASTALVSLYTAHILVEDGFATRLHNELSVRPHLTLSLDVRGNEGVGYALDSNGLGPAVIRWSEVLVDGESQPNWVDVYEKLGLKKDGDVEYNHPVAGAILRPGSSRKLLFVNSPTNTAQLKASHSRVEIKICYCSLYSEFSDNQCWQVTNHSSEGYPICDSRPEKIFLGTKFLE